MLDGPAPPATKPDEVLSEWRVRITQAAQRLGTTPRMLRYREHLGLLPPTAESPGRHRDYSPSDLAAAALVVELEQRHGVGPAELAFALRSLADPAVAADVRRLGELTARLPRPTRALDFDQRKAQRLLRPGWTRPPGAVQ